MLVGASTQRQVGGSQCPGLAARLCWLPFWWLLDEGEAPGFFEPLLEGGMSLRPLSLRSLGSALVELVGPSLQSTGASALRLQLGFTTWAATVYQVDD